MTKAECEKRIRKAVKTLNEMDNKLVFSYNELKDGDSVYGLQIEAASMDGSHHFGSYEPMIFFDDYRKKITAYETMMRIVDFMVASAKLNDPKAYHNMIAS